ncbi:RNA polymerase recycling motor HelD [Alicyclobacillus mengziensis]|uniref:UvrD-helicase domain-containing protein n=1 Tax=Alicyclobacillus mengziensis TaxID=2931921 RepID=A0A9X7Z832_9BACL|nr:RNA polymerase recycling motor HelD [Alicyclobacillus mengziensis]QSO47853.1 UvrD-helicase domain-containing protein [Alicyclobacillus mengziensis]
MENDAQEWKEEQLRVDRVVGEVSRQIAILRQRVEGIQSDIVDIRRDFWEEVTVNFEDRAEAAETMASIRQQAEVLSEQERSHQNARQQLKTLMRLVQSPYFGRIDFRADGETSSEPVYLGISSFADSSGDNFLVHDWRAPISSLYYDYVPGPAEYTAPDGIIQGTLDVKRQYLIKNSRILSMFDTGVTIGDELLQEVLGQHADTQMKSIVATIQREQNAVIRDTLHRLVIVEGAAGSGKTSAAMQRIAYLLYRYREHLKANQVVMFSPNPLFSSYVATVLPELGEENMNQTTFPDYLQGPVGHMLSLEDPFEQMETILTDIDSPGYSARIEGIRYKAGLAFKDLIDKYLGWLSTDGLIFRGLKFRGKVIVSGKRIKRQFYSYDASVSIPNRLRFLSQWILEELKSEATRQKSQKWVEEEIELLDSDTYHKVFTRLTRRGQFTQGSFEDAARERDTLAEIVIDKHFRRLRKAVKELRYVDVPAVYRQMFRNSEIALRLVKKVDLPPLWHDICAQTVAFLDNKRLTYEDATPYVYLRERLEGIRVNNAIRHVFIDEAQDYSPFQFACIKQLFPHARLTVLGDRNQAIHVHASIGEQSNAFASLLTLYQGQATETYRFSKSYRSTEQIVLFTKGILAQGATIDAFHREGRKPSLVAVPDRYELMRQVIQRIRELQERQHRTIAVVCKTQAESKEVHLDLKAFDVQTNLIDRSTSRYQSGVTVIPAYLAKGVEFDAVILFDASEKEYSRAHEQKLLYTACTRAMHELHVYYIEKMSPFLRGVSESTYVTE